jgi:hypothetical protein
MLEHLDDPNPPRPSAITVERIAAEGARRLRRRRFAAGGAMVVASTLAVVGMAVAAQPGDPDKVDTVGPGSTTTIADDLDPVPPVVDTTTSTPPTGGDETNGPPATGDAAPPDDVDDNDDIAAVVKDPDADQALVVLLDPFTGAVTRTLASYALTSRPPLCCVEIGDGVFYVVPAGQGGGDAPDTIWHVDLDGGQPTPVAQGTNPAASPDGTRLAFVRTSADGPAVVVHDLAEGEEQVIPAAVDDYLRDVEWYDDDTVLVTGQQPEAALEAIRLDVDAASLAGGTRLGPPEDAPAGTSWEWLDRRPDGRITITQNCCSLDAGTIENDSTYLLVDTVSGTITDGSGLPGHVAGLATAPTSDRELLLFPPPGAPGYGTLQILMDTELTPVPGNHQVLAADW